MAGLVRRPEPGAKGRQRRQALQTYDAVLPRTQMMHEGRVLTSRGGVSRVVRISTRGSHLDRVDSAPRPTLHLDGLDAATRPPGPRALFGALGQPTGRLGKSTCCACVERWWRRGLAKHRYFCMLGV